VISIGGDNFYDYDYGYFSINLAHDNVFYHVLKSNVFIQIRMRETTYDVMLYRAVPVASSVSKLSGILPNMLTVMRCSGRSWQSDYC
jgi:hypothetical protein